MRSISQAQGALQALAELLPDSAERVTDSGTEEVPLDALSVTTSSSSAQADACPWTASSWRAARMSTSR